MKQLVVFVALALFASTVAAQPRVTKAQKLDLDRSMAWGNPRFSPDGRSVFFTTAGYDGIWVYTIAERTARQLTADQGAGYGFSVEAGGGRVSYRRTSIDPGTHQRKQEVVLLDLQDDSWTVLGSGRDVSEPRFVGPGVVFSVSNQMAMRPSSTLNVNPVVLGIENTKIAILRSGSKVLLDPFGDGSYIWPSLSPVGKWIAAYEMRRGAFVCNLDGSSIVTLGRHDTPSWTHDGQWIIFMDQKDDGERVLSSHLMWVSPDGLREGVLTEGVPPDLAEPCCSLTGNVIVCSTLTGEIYLLEYAENEQ